MHHNTHRHRLLFAVEQTHAMQCTIVKTMMHAVLATSSRTGEGVAELRAAVVRLLAERGT